MRSADVVLAAVLMAGLSGLAGPLAAQTPLSAIDWLSDSVRLPAEPDAAKEPGVTGSALPGPVSVSPIGLPRADAVGLLPVTVSGLPADLWAQSSAGAIADRLRTMPGDLIPAMRDLIYVLLLAELDPPADSGPQADLLLARVDMLLGFGALEQAAALIDLAGPTTPELFRRAFDISLLLGTEDKTCAILRDTPALSPTFPARVFCLARGGDWSGAALSLDTARALGFLSEPDEALLVHFLELGLDEADRPLPIPIRPSPLEFRMFEAIGRPLPTASLPRAFAQTDLNRSSGWKAQIEAAERLVASGAIDANRLFRLYAENKPAAAGGVWDRAAAIQALDAAIWARDGAVLSAALKQAWAQIRTVDLELPFARAYCDRLAGRALDDEARDIRLTLCVLAGGGSLRLAAPPAPTPEQAFLLALALGQVLPDAGADPLRTAIRAGFETDGVPVRLQSLIDEGRKGEAILRSIDMFTSGGNGDLDELSDALRYLRMAGLEDTARQGAVQLLLLDRRG